MEGIAMGVTPCPKLPDYCRNILKIFNVCILPPTLIKEPSMLVMSRQHQTISPSQVPHNLTLEHNIKAVMTCAKGYDRNIPK